MGLYLVRKHWASNDHVRVIAAGLNRGAAEALCGRMNRLAEATGHAEAFGHYYEVIACPAPPAPARAWRVPPPEPEAVGTFFLTFGAPCE